MYVSGKMGPVETITRMGGEGGEGEQQRVYYDIS
jgi:hypothetical protein